MLVDSAESQAVQAAVVLISDLILLKKHKDQERCRSGYAVTPQALIWGHGGTSPAKGS